MILLDIIVLSLNLKYLTSLYTVFEGIHEIAKFETTGGTNDDRKDHNDDKYIIHLKQESQAILEDLLVRDVGNVIFLRAI